MSTVKEALKGKILLIVSSGYTGKKFVFDKLKAFGVKVILVDKKDCYAAPLVDYILDVDCTDVTNAPKLAFEKLQKFTAETGIKPDGIWNFWEDTVLVAAELGGLTGLPFNSVESGHIAKSKQGTRLAMEKAGLRTPKFYYIKSEDDLEKALATAPFPAVLKPVFGARAAGASKVDNPEEARAAYASNLQNLTSFDSIFSHGVDHVLEQYLDGDEVDVDILLQDGKIKFWSITDNLPTHEPDFVNTGSNLPSILPSAKQQELLDMAHKTATLACGMVMGAAHVEMKYTTNTGPQIIEVNARMCGAQYPQWIEAVWGVDFVEQCAAIALSIPISPFKPEKPLIALAGSFILADGPGVITQDILDLITKLKGDPRVFDAHWDTHVIPGLAFTEDGFGRSQLGALTIQGKTMREAVENFAEITDPEKLPLPDFITIVGAHLMPWQNDEIEPAERDQRRKSSIADFDSARSRRTSAVADDTRARTASVSIDKKTLSEMPLAVGAPL